MDKDELREFYKGLRERIKQLRMQHLFEEPCPCMRMMMTIKLLLCFLPLAMIWIIMKLSVWMFAINDEKNYVRAESRKPHGPYVEDPYADVDEEEEEYGDRTDYR